MRCCWCDGDVRSAVDLRTMPSGALDVAGAVGSAEARRGTSATGGRPAGGAGLCWLRVSRRVRTTMSPAMSLARLIGGLALAVAVVSVAVAAAVSISVSGAVDDVGEVVTAGRVTGAEPDSE